MRVPIDLGRELAGKDIAKALEGLDAKEYRVHQTPIIGYAPALDERMEEYEAAKVFSIGFNGKRLSVSCELDPHRTYEMIEFDVHEPGFEDYCSVEAAREGNQKSLQQFATDLYQKLRL